jgi:hypothetical protein
LPRAAHLFSLLVTIYLATAVPAGCDEPADDGPIGDEPRVSSTDHEIIEMVLLDLLEFDEFNRTTDDGTRSKIVLSDKTVGSSAFLSDEHLGGEGHDKEDWLIPAEIRVDLRQRNGKKPVSLSKFKPTGKNILLKDISKFQSQLQIMDAFPDAKRYVEAWLPGYSEDGKAAIVRFWFGPSFHGATATYLLVKIDGKWKVKWRKTAHYA